MAPSERQLSAEICLICGDGGAKKHYGTISCDGCKAFFRRVVRLKISYQCRNGGCCTVFFGYRNVCRKCRFDKCISVGMRPEAVQNERDSIRRRSHYSDRQPSLSIPLQIDDSSPISVVPPVASPPLDNLWPSPEVFSQSQLDSGGVSSVSSKSELTSPQPPLTVGYAWKLLVNPDSIDVHRFSTEHYKAVIGRAMAVDNCITDECRHAMDQLRQLESVSQKPFGHELNMKLLKQQLLPVINAFKQLEAFGGLPLQDQVNLLRNYAPAAVLMNDVRRSAPLFDTVALFDGIHNIPRGAPCAQGTWKHPKLCTQLIGNLLDNLIPSYRELGPDNVEYVCLKSICFWNPDVCSKDCKSRVKKWRQMFLVSLEKYISEHSAREVGRQGSLHMFLKAIENTSEKYRTLIVEEYFDRPDCDPLVFELFKFDDSVLGNSEFPEMS